MFAIEEDDLTSDETRSLLALHLAGMHANSPPGAVSALDLTGLKAPGVNVWTARKDGRVAGISALKRLGGGSGELKSMRTHPDFLRMGVAGALLEHLIAVAKGEGLNRLSLETGSGPSFEPALALYRKRGFQNGPAFSDYVKSDFNQFLHLPLS